jgi:hypothetical protein
VDAITRENRLNILLALSEKYHNEKVDIFYRQDISKYNIIETQHLIDKLLLDDTKVIPWELLDEGNKLLSW